MTPVRYQSLVRCLRLARFLVGRRYLPPYPEMAREIGCSVRTVRRYIEAFEEARCPLPPRIKA